MLAMALAMAAAVSLTLAARVGNGSPPGLSSAFLGAVNSTDVHIVPAKGPAAVSEESAVSAALAQEPPGASSPAAELVTLTDSRHPAGVLAWAVQTIPVGGYIAGGGPVPGANPNVPVHYTPPRRNFRVDFVDASTGAWLGGVSGYGPGL